MQCYYNTMDYIPYVYPSFQTHQLNTVSGIQQESALEREL